MKQQKHGGNVWAYDKQILDFSASLNPFGMPPEVQDAAMEGVRRSIHYPDPHCQALKTAIAQVENVPEAFIFCANGATELLDRLALALRPHRAMLTAPTFGEYQRSLQMVHCKINRYYLKKEQSFDLTTDFLRVLRPNLDLVILCNPNNPTGRTIERSLLREVLRWCKLHGVTLFVDESFQDLTDPNCQDNLSPLLAEYPNLVLLRSLTKSYCMAGLRLGYLLTSNQALLNKLNQCGQPWNVSVPAQYAGTAALTQCPDWAKMSAEQLTPLREALQQSLSQLGCEVWQGKANYLLFQVSNCTDLVERLLKHDILIRSCQSFEGLGRDFYRIAVRTERENQALLSALKSELEVLERGKNGDGKADYDTRYSV